MKRTFTTIGVFVLLVTLAACTTNRMSQQDGNTQAVLVVSTTIQELYERADVIVIGQPAATAEVINMARDIHDPSIPDISLFIIGQAYEIQVEEYLKGAGPEIIYVVQNEGIIPNRADPNLDEITEARKTGNFVAMQMHRTYLFYLDAMLGAPEDTYFVGTSHPWRFSVEDRNRIVPETPWTEADKYFPAISLSDTMKLFHSTTLEVDLTYPAPSTSSQDMTVPYP